MKRNFSKILLLLFLITIVFANCKKGDTGPAGPAGPTGANGGAGPQGPKGDTGTANVIYSQWLDVPFLPDTVHNGTTIDTLGYSADIAAAKLDSLILSKGEIKVYLNLGSSANPDVVPLPYIAPLNNGFNGTIFINPEFIKQHIILTSNVDPGTFTQNNVKFLQYRYILIPGSVGGVMKQTNWNDYNQVKTALGLTN